MKVANSGNNYAPTHGGQKWEPLPAPGNPAILGGSPGGPFAPCSGSIRPSSRLSWSPGTRVKPGLRLEVSCSSSPPSELSIGPAIILSDPDSGAHSCQPDSAFIRNPGPSLSFPKCHVFPYPPTGAIPSFTSDSQYKAPFPFAGRTPLCLCWLLHLGGSDPSLDLSPMLVPIGLGTGSKATHAEGCFLLILQTSQRPDGAGFNYSHFTGEETEDEKG